MKIIGRAGEDVIAQLTKSDMASLVGERYFDQDAAQRKLAKLGLVDTGYNGGHPQIGATVDLAGRFNRILAIEYRHEEMKVAAKTLRTLAGLLDHVGDELIVPPAEEKA